VRRCGGVIEHPKGSHAWAHFGLARPPQNGGWIRADSVGWTCCVYQAHYGHRALKPTWLYFVGKYPLCAPAPLKWGRPVGNFVPISGASFKSKAHREAAIRAGWKYVPRLATKDSAKTPIPFRDLLISLARSCAEE
jgi:hypothetical protein